MKTPNWYVITGAPCSGKTTVLNTLKSRGHITVDEAARVYIDQEIKKTGRSIEDLRKKDIVFQRRVLEMKLHIEEQIPRGQLTLFDRGIPDSFAYYILCGVHYDKFLAKSMMESSYKGVFLFEPLPYEKDYSRAETEEQRALLHTLLKESYERIGMEVVSVPVMSIEERSSFILDHIE